MKEGRDSGGPSISEGLWFSRSRLSVMKRAAEQLADKGIKLEVLGEQVFEGKDQVKVRITGGDPEHGLSPYWRRVEKLQEEPAILKMLLD